MIRPLTRKIGGWWRICYHGHPTPDHYTRKHTPPASDAYNTQRDSRLQ